jgi:hypothetical protein
MRWYILRALIHKEALRHLANRGGLALVLLLLVAAMLLSFFGGRDGALGGGLSSGVRLCFVDYWEDGPLLRHLEANVPRDLEKAIKFRPIGEVPTDSAGRYVYPRNTGAIQLREAPRPGGWPRVYFWHPGADASALAPFEVWFWKESFRFAQAQKAAAGAPASLGAAPAAVEAEHARLAGGMDWRSGLATSLVVFALFFVCVYLLPSLTCEERERGVLLAQALSPASPREILAAKFLFYPAIAVGLAAGLAGTYQPLALTRLFFWLSLAVAVVGSMGIGLTIASLARTQRGASMGALCYMMAVALLLFICQQNNIPGLPNLALEHHCPRMLHAALVGHVQGYEWLHLAGAAGLAAVWAGLASALFRRYGWQ